jgi:hypothetical protein
MYSFFKISISVFLDDVLDDVLDVVYVPGQTIGVGDGSVHHDSVIGIDGRVESMERRTQH